LKEPTNHSHPILGVDEYLDIETLSAHEFLIILSIKESLNIDAMRRIQPVPGKMRLEMLAKGKSKSSMVKVHFSFQMRRSKRSLG